MDKVTEYFSTVYFNRLKTLKAKVHNQIEFYVGKEDEFKKWIDDELAFFYAGTKNQVKVLGKVENTAHKLAVTFEFISVYLLDQLTDEEVETVLKGYLPESSDKGA